MSNREQPIQVNEISSTTGNNVEEDTASVTTVEWHAPDLFDSYTDSDTDSEPSYFHCRSPSPRDSPDGVDPSDEENRNSPRSPRQERFFEIFNRPASRSRSPREDVREEGHDNRNDASSRIVDPIIILD